MTTPTIADTDALTAAAHLGQVDKAGRPYIEHPRAVAAMLAEHGDLAVIAGLLHDVVEDTPITLDDLRAAGYPEVAVDAVDAVSRREGETYMDLIRRAAAHPLGRLVKLADNRHNSSEDRLAHLDPENAEFLRRRYAKARAVLLAGSTEGQCRCHHSHAAISPTHGGHCCFVPASQTCHPAEVAAWTEGRR